MNSTSAISLMLLISCAVNAADLRSETTHAWENYLASAEVRMAESAHGNFLWIDEIVVAPMQPKMPIALSRNIPTTLHSVVDPSIRGVAKASLTTSLEESRKAVETIVESASLSSKAGGL